MIRKDVGATAGYIWQLLSSRGSLTLRQIGECTHRKDSLILMAIGWLYKENKVFIRDVNGILYFDVNKVFSETYY